MDLVVHQMAGILPEAIRENISVPSGFEPVTGLAIGYSGDPQALPSGIREREHAPRSRKSLQEFVFTKTWGETPGFF